MNNTRESIEDLDDVSLSKEVKNTSFQSKYNPNYNPIKQNISNMC